MNRILEIVGRRLGAYLTREAHAHSTSPPSDFRRLRNALRPADVLLVEGNSRISTAIKYLTQSTWSHAALYVGEAMQLRDKDGQPLEFIEADVLEGVRAVSVRAFAGFHCRICRPINLSPDDAAGLIKFASDHIGHRYDLKNIIDLARYLFPTPPVPTRWRRRMIAFGKWRSNESHMLNSHCASVSVGPVSSPRRGYNNQYGNVAKILRARHHSLYVPRDFDVSPYFAVVKPSLDAGFDYRAVTWAA